MTSIEPIVLAEWPKRATSESRSAFKTAHRLVSGSADKALAYPCIRAIEEKTYENYIDNSL